ncbi:MAG TPA: lytic transglycosylase domain-containing protein [Hyphomonadaceae bacterium]|jgi:soluble lytic murein transglycosylase-like protein|nr:lytic transglycosylase domain-containing protein [Hyphomonadaceae bacterium]HPN05732.1 lytic transglycosylase domain-containing protein [Hyphomonadaceae bacterium]
MSSALQCALVSAALGFACALPAAAQVLEIGPAGVTSIVGPNVITADGVQSIAPVRPAARTASVPSSTQPLLDQAGVASALSPQLLEAVAYVESRFRHNAVSPKGAIGMMQLMPATAGDLGVDPRDPAQNARGGAAYLRQMLAMFDNNVELAVAAYNAGPNAVRKHNGVPPYAETRAYVAAVMDYLARTSVPETK